MASNHNINAIESRVAFCERISEGISCDGFDVKIRPGEHLVDDAGADSLIVLNYIVLLQELGLNIDLGEFDTDLLNTDVAYQQWLQGIAVQSQRGS